MRNLIAMRVTRIIILALLVMSCKQQPITMNLYYTGENGSARKFMEEMESSGTASAIRADEDLTANDAKYIRTKDETMIQTVDFSVWPQGEPNTAYAQYFTGNSYLAPLEAGLMNVTFEPRCRNNWHIHHKQVQVLICVAGRGWYQEWGKEAVPMTPGTIISVPAEVKHWHGAAADSWFQHITYHKDVQEGASNEWLEPVTDSIYDSLK